MNLGTHHRTADIVAHRIHKVARQYLVSKDVLVSVDLDKGQFLINGGRHGRGRIEVIPEVAK